MKLLKQLLVSISLVLATVNAQATVYNLGALSNVFLPPYPFLVSGDFVDTFNFTLPDISNTDFGASPFNLNIVGNVPYWHISDFTVSLLDSDGVIRGSGQSFSIPGLAAGDYHLDVAGNADGLGGGLYAGFINVAAVPEPDTYAMMFVGLGLIGFMVRRKSKQS